MQLDKFIDRRAFVCNAELVAIKLRCIWRPLIWSMHGQSGRTGMEVVKNTSYLTWIMKSLGLWKHASSWAFEQQIENNSKCAVQIAMMRKMKLICSVRWESVFKKEPITSRHLSPPRFRVPSKSRKFSREISDLNFFCQKKLDRLQKILAIRLRFYRNGSFIISSPLEISAQAGRKTINISGLNQPSESISMGLKMFCFFSKKIEEIKKFLPDQDLKPNNGWFWKINYRRNSNSWLFSSDNQSKWFKAHNFVTWVFLTNQRLFNLQCLIGWLRINKMASFLVGDVSIFQALFGRLFHNVSRWPSRPFEAD